MNNTVHNFPLVSLQIDKEVNNMTIHMPYQQFINGEFVDSSDGRTFDSLNPTDGSVSICFLNSDFHSLGPAFSYKMYITLISIIFLQWGFQRLINLTLI